MANWASVDYVIEGPKETLKRIYDAIQHPVVEPDSDERWEGNVLNTLGIEWRVRQPDGSGYYIRGFIQDKESIEFNPDINDTLTFYAEEAWGITDFHKLLEKGIPGIKVYYCVVEENDELYATNDKEGKYYSYRWNADICVNNVYNYEEFTTEKSLYEWLDNKTNGEIKNAEDVEVFNAKHEEVGDDDKNYINIHAYSVVE